MEGLEQELADITDSGDFAAYQVLIHTIEHFDLDLILDPHVDDPEDFATF